MSDLRKAAEMALEALENTTDFVPVKSGLEREVDNAIQALRQALAQDALQKLAEIDHSLGLFIDEPPVKSYCGGKPNYCTEPEDWTKSKGYMKVVINRDYGGFGLSDEAIRLYAEKKGLKLNSRESSGFTNYFFEEDGKFFDDRDLSRDDPILVEIVETLTSEKASGPYALLKVVEIPDDVKWEVKEYDGMEWIAEVHRTWA